MCRKLINLWIYLAFSAVVLASFDSVAKGAGNNVSQVNHQLFNSQSKRPVNLTLWFKKGNCKDEATDKHCLNEDVNTRNVAFLSHGAMGAARDYNWLAYPLAMQGWLVVGLNHFGESWIYGKENVDPSSVSRFWQRAEDTSFVLDSFIANNPFSRDVDWHQVVFIGHSSGGHTAATLAGVMLDAQQMGQYCSSNKGKDDKGCGYATRAQAEKLTVVSNYGQSYKDERIKAIIMLDPAMGPAVTKSSLQQVAVPALVIGARNNDFLPFEHHAAYYAEHMKEARLVGLNGDEGHFVFLDACNHKYKAKGVSLCEDKPGVSRKQVHQKLLGHVMPFVSAL